MKRRVRRIVVPNPRNRSLQAYWQVSMNSPMCYGDHGIPSSMCLKFRRKMFITVEPVLFLYMFGLYLLLSVEEQYIFNRLGREEYIRVELHRAFQLLHE